MHVGNSKLSYPPLFFNSYFYFPIDSNVTGKGYIALVKQFEANDFILFQAQSYTATYGLSSNHSSVGIGFGASTFPLNTIVSESITPAAANVSWFPQKLLINESSVSLTLNFHTTTFPYNLLIDGPCSDNVTTFNYGILHALPTWISFASNSSQVT